MLDPIWLRFLLGITAAIFLSYAVRGFISGEVKTGAEYISFGPYSADSQPVRFLVAQCWNIFTAVFCAYWAFAL
ncbi:hypothetical protein ACOYW6_05300 [Parablastomonas sp. CN1-191]|uniref:hypothetical protein n=1 Tax=Parablastomonas sp. CN1-191 TaxID=3400908 RepID=UPI003BF81D5C